MCARLPEITLSALEMERKTLTSCICYFLKEKEKKSVILFAWFIRFAGVYIFVCHLELQKHQLTFLFALIYAEE